MVTVTMKMRACKLQVFSFLSVQNNDGLAQEEDSNIVSWVTAIQPVSEFDTIAKSSFYNNAL